MLPGPKYLMPWEFKCKSILNTEVTRVSILQVPQILEPTDSKQ